MSMNLRLIFFKTMIFLQALQYNVPHGKTLRGLTAIYAYKQFTGKDKLTTENIRNGQLFGWLIEAVRRLKENNNNKKILKSFIYNSL